MKKEKNRGPAAAAYYRYTADKRAEKQQKGASGMDKKKRKASKEERVGADDPFYNINNTASASECTGLVPAGITDEAQADVYGELYGIHPPKTP